MAVEIIDLPNGKRGMANFSSSRNCAFAVVMAIPRTKKSDAVVMFHGRETARFKVEYPLHVFITNDCVGVFEDDGRLVVFHAEGVLFKTAMPNGLGGVTGFEVTPDGFVITGGRLARFVFDMTGHLINSGKETGFYQGDGPAHLRWDRYREADALLAKGKLAKAKALYDVCVDEFTDSPTHQAAILRKLGEISLQLNNKDEAIDYWTLALDANPKVGVKKKLEALQAGG
jgi:hypothetical protein